MTDTKNRQKQKKKEKEREKEKERKRKRKREKQVKCSRVHAMFIKVSSVKYMDNFIIINGYFLSLIIYVFKYSSVYFNTNIVNVIDIKSYYCTNKVVDMEKNNIIIFVQ